MFAINDRHLRLKSPLTAGTRNQRQSGLEEHDAVVWTRLASLQIASAANKLTVAKHQQISIIHRQPYLSPRYQTVMPA